MAGKISTASGAQNVRRTKKCLLINHCTVIGRVLPIRIIIDDKSIV